jgi:hypothetical protein
MAGLDMNENEINWLKKICVEKFNLTAEIIEGKQPIYNFYIAIQ